MKTEKASREEILARATEEDAIPSDSLTPEQAKRRRDREKKRKQREGERKEKAASRMVSQSEWWDKNRATLPAETLQAMREQDVYLRDVLFSMESIVNVEWDPELIGIVLDLVKQHGVVHLSYIVKDPDIPPDWSSQSYWQDRALLAKLYAEGPATEIFVRFGFLSALPDWKVEQFLTTKAGWTWEQATSLLGQKASRGGMRYV